MASLPRLLAGLAISVFLLCGTSAGIPNTAVVEQICARINFRDEGLFYSCLHKTFIDICTQAPLNGYSYMEECDMGNEHSGKLFGFGACNRKLSADDCASCLEEAGLEMGKFCKNGIGAQQKLVDCRLRYEQYSFDPN